MQRQNKIVLYILLPIALIGIFFHWIEDKDEKEQRAREQKAREREERQLEVNVILNERQKKVLEKEGLPLDYDKLTHSQQDGIYQIGKSLEYLEAKYDREFEYLSYIYGGQEGKHVKAVSKDFFPEKIVIVKIASAENKVGEERYTYTDNFDAKLAEEIYPKEAKEFLVKYLEEDDFKVYIEISELIPKGNSIVAKAMGAPSIFVKNEYSEEEIEAIAKAYVQWIAVLPGAVDCAASFLVMDTERFNEVEEFNYVNYYGKEISWLSAYADSSGKLKLEWYRKDANGKRIYE